MKLWKGTVKMKYPSDNNVMYDYLKAASEALCEEHNQNRANRILQQACHDFARPNKESQLLHELNDFVEWIVHELEDDMGWYFLDDNLAKYMKDWKAKGLI